MPVIRTELGKYLRTFIAIMVILEFAVPLMVLYFFSRKLANEASNAATTYMRNFIHTEPKEITL